MISHFDLRFTFPFYLCDWESISGKDVPEAEKVSKATKSKEKEMISK